MNPLAELGARILADVTALVARREPPILDHLTGDDLNEAEPTTATGVPRRADEAAPLIDPKANPSVPTGMPVRGLVSSHYGMRFHPIRKRWLPHRGEDIAAPIGTTVSATADGLVMYAGRRGSFGNLVEIDHGGGYRTRYAHLSTIAVSAGTTVARGSAIGAVGQTGGATGPHCHYEVLVRGAQVDPKPFMR